MKIWKISRSTTLNQDNDFNNKKKKKSNISKIKSGGWGIDQWKKKRFDDQIKIQMSA